MSRFTYLVGFVVLLHASCCIGFEGENVDQDEIVDLHNDLRRGVTPAASNMLKMSWSTKAASAAHRWAATCSMVHSSGSDCGENLFMSSNERSWSDAIQSWYDEVKDYQYGVGSVNGSVIGHYTQVVWYRSNEIGCAMAHCPSAKYKYFYVCRYCPAGNYQDTHPYKEGKPCADCPGACDNGLCTNPCAFEDKYGNCASLKKDWGCKGDVGDWCPASCKCTSEII